MSNIFLESMSPKPLTFHSSLTIFLSQTPTFLCQPPTSKQFESPAVVPVSRSLHRTFPSQSWFGANADEITVNIWEIIQFETVIHAYMYTSTVKHRILSIDSSIIIGRKVQANWF